MPSASSQVSGLPNVPSRANDLVIGLDLGGTKLIAALADGTGRLLAEIEEPTRAVRRDGVLDQIAGVPCTGSERSTPVERVAVESGRIVPVA